MNGLPLETRKPPIPYTPDLYLNGLVPLPPWLSFKKQRFYSYSFSSTSLTPNQQQAVVTMDGDAFFLLEGIQVLAYNGSGSAVQPLQVSFSDSSKGINWAPTNVAFSDIGGVGMNPKYLTFPTLFKPGSSIYYQLTNNPATVPVYGAFFGRKIYGLTLDEAKFLMRRVWFQYSVSVGPVPFGVGNSFPVQTANDSDFYLWKMSCSAGITYSKSTGPLLINVRDITSNKNLLASQAEVQTIAGEQYAVSTSNLNGSLFGKPFCFQVPRLIKRNSTVVVDILNNAPSGADFGSNNNPVQFVLDGVRVFD